MHRLRGMALFANISRYWYRTMFDEHFPSYCASTVMRWTPTWSKQTDPSGRYACPYWLAFNYGNRSTNWLTIVQLQSTKTNTTKQNENFRLPRLSRSLLYKSMQISLGFQFLRCLGYGTISHSLYLDCSWRVAPLCVISFVLGSPCKYNAS